MEIISRTFVLVALVACLLFGCGEVQPDRAACSDGTTCSGHGDCDESGGQPRCICDEGWTGAYCDRCIDGYIDRGDGTCQPMNSCEQYCANQNRVCAGQAVDYICGECLEGYYEDANGQCISACAAETHPGEIVPLDLYIMLDRSSSMDDSGKWGAVTTAIETFVTSSDTAGIGVGLQYFPLEPSGPIPTSCSSDADCGLYGPCVPMMNVCGGSMATDTSCDPADYYEAEVDIAELPGVEPTILSSLAGQSPQGPATPTEPAMAGAVHYATAWAQAHPDHLVFIVFATDGEPTGCSTNSISGTAGLAADAAGGDPSVKTFVIGVGESLSSLNEIASAGGTGQAYLVDTGGNVTDQFIQALNEIRANGLCRYQIPEPDQGIPDYDLINVSLRDPSDPANDTTVPYVGAEADCDATVGGWYYDDPQNPEMILLCPVTCEAVAQDNLVVEILVGCETIVL